MGLASRAEGVPRSPVEEGLGVGDVFVPAPETAVAVLVGVVIGVVVGGVAIVGVLVVLLKGRHFACFLRCLLFSKFFLSLVL